VKTAKELAEALFRENDDERRAQMDAVIDHLKSSFGSLSLEALSRTTDEFLKLAKVRLESERQSDIRDLSVRKELIDQQLQKMTIELDNVSRLMRELEKDRVEKFGELTRHLQLAGEQTALLATTTSSLREALSSTKARGQWGERMAEDVLHLAGLKENVNYLRQKTMAGTGSRPDFTFLLPRNLRLNMDVKFPLDNYMRFLDAPAEGEKTKFRADFLRDVRAKIKEVTTRDYIDPSQNTMDYVLLFIPNEQVYAFIHEQDNLILEESLRQRVICCSPVTLFAVLAVIRQAVDCFSLEQTSNEILSLIGLFKKQWDEFLRKLESVGKRIEDLNKEFDALATTRRRQLERPLRRMEEIRNERGLREAEDEPAGEPKGVD
jgi:DNA recombination protein RmuC